MTDKVKDIEFRNKIVEWLKANNWYAVLHDGHFGRYFHIRKLDETCKDLDSNIYGAFLESYDYEFSGKGKLVADYNFHLDAKHSWEFFYKLVVLKEDVPEERYCEVCGKALSDKEYYTCTEHTKSIKFNL